MLKINHIAIAIIFFFALSHQPVFAKTPAIKELIDGFTYQLKDGKIVRLIGINSDKNAQEAAELLKKNKLTNRSVKLEFDEKQTDDQGRLLAYVICGSLLPGLRKFDFSPRDESQSFYISH